MLTFIYGSILIFCWGFCHVCAVRLVCYINRRVVVLMCLLSILELSRSCSKVALFLFYSSLEAAALKQRLIYLMGTNEIRTNDPMYADKLKERLWLEYEVRYIRNPYDQFANLIATANEIFI